MDMQPFLTHALDKGVLRLVLNRPAQRNPLSMGMLDALNAEMDAAMRNDAINVVVIAANGPAFCAGHDLKELTAARAANDGGERFFQETFAACETLMLTIATGPKPVVAEVQGLATAAGCQLVAACDLAIASDQASFATPGVNIGLFCSTPAVPLVRNIGAKRAAQMLFTGEAISAATALESGLLSEVVPAGELTARTRQIADLIVAKPPAVVALGKRTLLAQKQMPLKEAYALASGTMTRNLVMDEAIAGIGAFIAARRPKPME
jgi:enoyl-CoA hydratase/carnithine racemase